MFTAGGGGRGWEGELDDKEALRPSVLATLHALGKDTPRGQEEGGGGRGYGREEELNVPATFARLRKGYA